MNNQILNQFRYIANKKAVDSVTSLSITVKKLCEENGQYEEVEAFDHTVESIPSGLNRINSAITALLPHIIETNIDLVSAEEEIKRLQKQSQTFEEDILKLNASYSREKAELEQQVRTAGEKAAMSEKRYEELVASIMTFRDQMMYFKDNSQNEDMKTLLQNLYKESGRIVAKSGVELLNGDGAFSTDTQIVKGTVTTEVKELAETIQSTVRDGYRMNGKLMRPQEVILYVENDSSL
jgi:molecular chaperone GrpE (heat shock protein)